MLFPCATLLPRRFAAWLVEAPLFAVSPRGGPCNLRSLWLDAWPETAQYPVKGKVLDSSAVARTTSCRACSFLPYGLVNVNPY